MPLNLPTTDGSEGQQQATAGVSDAMGSRARRSGLGAISPVRKQAVGPHHNAGVKRLFNFSLSVVIQNFEVMFK